LNLQPAAAVILSLSKDRRHPEPVEGSPRRAFVVSELDEETTIVP